MSLTSPYRQKNYMGEYAAETGGGSVLEFIQGNKWDSSGDGAGTPRAGMTFFDSNESRMKVYTGASWDDMSGISQLSDLTDVGDTTATAGRLLVADGDSWESRAVSGAITMSGTGVAEFIATAETTVDDADLVLIYDDSEAAYRRMTRANFLSGLEVIPDKIEEGNSFIEVVDTGSGAAEINLDGNTRAEFSGEKVKFGNITSGGFSDDIWSFRGQRYAYMNLYGAWPTEDTTALIMRHTRSTDPMGMTKTQDGDILGRITGMGAGTSFYHTGGHIKFIQRAEYVSSAISTDMTIELGRAWVGTNELFRFTYTGRLGIGTSNPSSSVHVESDSSARFDVREAKDDTDGPDMIFVKARGTMAARTSVTSGDFLGRIKAYGTVGTDYFVGGEFFFETSEDWGTDSYGTDFAISLATNGAATTSEKFRFTNSGRLGIGTDSPGGTLGLLDANTYITRDGSSNLSFTDAVTGTKTLAELSAGGATPGGSSTEIQYRVDASTFGGAGSAYWDSSYSTLVLGEAETNLFTSNLYSFQIAREESSPSISMITTGSTGSTSPTIWMTHSQGTLASPQATTSGDWLGQIIFGGVAGSSWSNRAVGVKMYAKSTESWGSDRGAQFAIATTNTDDADFDDRYAILGNSDHYWYGAGESSSALMVLDVSTTRLGIGTTSPGGTLGLLDANTYITRDGSNNLSFTDAVTGTKTLAELSAGGASPAGTGSEIQYRVDGSTFGGASNAHWDDTNKALVLGVATAAPFTSTSIPLYITGENSSKQIVYQVVGDGDAETGYLSFQRAHGTTYGTHTAVEADEVLGYIMFQGATDSTWDTRAYGAQIYVQATQNFSGTQSGTRMRFKTVRNGQTSAEERMALEGDGEVILYTDNGTTPGLTVVYGKSGLLVGSGTSDPSTPNDGQLYYNTTSDVLRLRANSAWVDIATGTVGATDKIEEGDSSVEVIDTGSDGHVVVTLDGAEHWRFANDGALLQGGYTDISFNGASSHASIVISDHQVPGSLNAGLAMQRGNGGPYILSCATGPSGSLSSKASVADTNLLAAWIVYGWVGTTYRTAGMLKFLVDGTPSGSVVPTAFEIQTVDTTAQGVRYKVNGNADQVWYGAGGSPSEVMFLDVSESRLGIGTTSPGGTLGLVDANTYITRDGSNNLSFTDAVTGTKTLAQLAAGAASPAGSGTEIQYRVDGSTFGAASVMNYDSSESIVMVGNVTSAPFSTSWPMWVAMDGSSCGWKVSSAHSAPGAYIQLIGMRDTHASPDPLQDGDALGAISFSGVHTADTNSSNGVQIVALASGNWSSSNYGADLLFNTVTDGTTSLETRYRIDGAGDHTWYGAGGSPSEVMFLDVSESRLGVGTTSPGGTLGLVDANTYITRDGSNNLSFTDAVTGTKTLAQLAAGAASAFTDLTDTPSSYTTANAFVTTNGTPDALIETTVVLTESANTFNITKGTAVLDVAAGASFDVNASCTIDQDLQQSASPTFADLALTGDFEVGSTSWHYWGDASTDGSWRFGRNATDQTTMVLQKRVSTVWTTVQEFSA